MTDLSQPPVNDELERVLAAARDSLTDEMVGRLAETAAEALSLLDRLQRSGALATIERLLQAFEAARAETAATAPASGGLAGLWSLARDAQSQEALRLLVNVGKRLRA